MQTKATATTASKAKAETTSETKAAAKPVKPAANAAPKTKPAVKSKPAPKPAPKAAAAPKADDKANEQSLADRIATERKTAAEIFAQAASSVSVPIKTLTAFKRGYKRDVTAHAIGRKPSPRQAAALAVALTAAGKKPANGVKFSRKFDMRGASYAIENGALSDAIASGLCTYEAETETVTLRNAAEFTSQLGAIAIKI